MANKKISELDPAAALTGAELVEIVQGGTNVQTTTQDIADLGRGTITDGNGTTANGTAVDLGGNITEGTTITGGGFDFEIGTVASKLNTFTIRTTGGVNMTTADSGVNGSIISTPIQTLLRYDDGTNDCSIDMTGVITQTNAGPSNYGQISIGDESTSISSSNNANTESSSLDVNSSGIHVTDTRANRGIQGQADFSANIQDNDFTQKVYVDTKSPKVVQLAVSDEITALTTGTAKVTFRMPFAMTLTAVRASLTTAQSSGSIFTVDINESGSTILSTKITIDNAEKTSTTAATPPVISDSALADDAEITVDIDQIGDGTAKGLKISLIGV